MTKDKKVYENRVYGLRITNGIYLIDPHISFYQWNKRDFFLFTSVNSITSVLNYSIDKEML